VHGLDDEAQAEWVGSRGIELVRGHGRIEGERRVRAGGEVLEAREAVVVAVGSATQMPPIPGLAEAEAWTNREATTASEVPERLIVLGGGVVGVELAQAWRSLGSEVVLVERSDGLLVREEPFVGRELEDSLTELGIDVRTGTQATRVERCAAGTRIELDGGEAVEGDRLLVAVGRRPRTDELGLDTIGLEPGGFLEVDETLRVPGHPWLYAVGDVNGRALLTHMGKYQARLAADRIAWGGDGHIAPSWDAELRPGGPSGDLRAHGPTSPRVIFTDPQVAAVGHTLESARAAGVNARAVDLPTSGTAGGTFYGARSRGTTRFVVDDDREVLAGVTFVGPEVADLLHSATIAVVGAVPLRTLVHAVAPFPARSEIWLKFLEAYGL
jgi:pyruvate/2-oxoglutarate dehydrogenase complex dihydrolipoamide dehydrogenase (E3) component